MTPEQVEFERMIIGIILLALLGNLLFWAVLEWCKARKRGKKGSPSAATEKRTHQNILNIIVSESEAHVK